MVAAGIAPARPRCRSYGRGSPRRPRARPPSASPHQVRKRRPATRAPTWPRSSPTCRSQWFSATLAQGPALRQRRWEYGIIVATPLAEEISSLLRQRHAMLDPRLHSGGRDGPDHRVVVDLAPAHVEHFGRAGGGQHQEGERPRRHPVISDQRGVQLRRARPWQRTMPPVGDGLQDLLRRRQQVALPVLATTPGWCAAFCSTGIDEVDHDARGAAGFGSR